MKKILLSIKLKPVNLILIISVLILYLSNNVYLKNHTNGSMQKFFVCYFNDLICPLLFFSYSNILLICVSKELKKLKWIMLMGLCTGLVWEFFAPVIKPSSVTDVIDLICYLLGTFLYWYIMKLVDYIRKWVINDKS